MFVRRNVCGGEDYQKHNGSTVVSRLQRPVERGVLICSRAIGASVLAISILAYARLCP